MPDLRSDNHSYLWEDGKKTQTIRMKLSDEAVYITTAKMVKENSFKNYFHLHELEKYPEGLTSILYLGCKYSPSIIVYGVISSAKTIFF